MAAKNTLTMLEMADGTKVALTLSYRYLLKLSKLNPQAYAGYNAAYNKGKGQFEEFDTVRMAYAAYLCGCIHNDDFDSAMTWDQFIDNMTDDRQDLAVAMRAVLTPKHPGDSAMLLQ